LFAANLPVKGKFCYSHTVAENTWFESCYISAATCMLLTYSFAVNFNFDQTIHESSLVEGRQIFHETVANRFYFCREICMITLDEWFEEEGRIGDVSEIVEIDECKIGVIKLSDRCN